MNLQRKISLIFVLIVVAFGTGTYIILPHTLMPAFHQLESQAAAADVARAQQGLSTLGDALGNFATDWAHWDDCFDYMLGKNDGFVGINLGLETLSNVDLNLVLLYDVAGSLRWGKYIDDETGEARQFSDAIIPDDAISSLLQLETPLSEIDGFVSTPHGPAMVSSRPIVHSDRSGPIVGTLVLGQLINRERISQLRRMTEVDLALIPATISDSPVQAALSRAATDDMVTQEVSDWLRTSSQVLRDVVGQPVVSLIVRSPRGISRLGREAVQGVMISIAILGSAIIIGIWWLLRYLVVSPVRRLQQTMTTIQDGDDLSRRIEVHRADEIGQLGDAFNTMVGKLEESKRSYIEQSFKAGMAEVAVGVLHNIRNMLMPIINGVAAARNSMARPTGQNTARAIEELGSASTTDERKEKLLTYLSATHDNVILERDNIREDLDSLSHQLDRVTSVLQEQERYTHAAPVLESVNLAKAVDEARDVIPPTGEPAVAVVVDEKLVQQHVRAHRVGLLQVLSNLLLNAYESIKRTGRGQGQIQVLGNVEENGDDRRIRITIRDTGAGIEPDALLRIFESGYTSKIDSFGGLGLHWSANALAGMQGRIEASSDGVDKGAEFHITLEAA